jgi:hypothetical protein
MKALFFAINLLIGLVGAVLGVATLVSFFGASHNFAVIVVGLTVLAMAGVCLCFCGDCLCLRRKQNHTHLAA